MSRLQQSTQQSARLSQRQKVLAGGVVLISAMAIVLAVFWGSIGNVNDASAGNNDGLTEAAEYWGVNAITQQEMGEKVDLEIWADVDIFLSAKVLNKAGEIVSQSYITVEKGTNHHTIDGLQVLPAGEYVVEVSGEDKAVAETIVKE